MWRKGHNVPAKLKDTARALQDTIDRTEQIISQTAAVQQGNTRIHNRIISMFDTEARPIRRGKVTAPTEFGYKLLLVESEEKIITDYQVLDGNPNDDTLLESAVDRYIKLLGVLPGRWPPTGDLEVSVTIRFSKNWG